MNSKLVLATFALVMLSANAMSIALVMFSVIAMSHEGQYAWYTFDEGPTGNRCSSAASCDGQRTCSPYGWCQGTSRPSKGTGYNYNETVTGNRCPQSPSDPFNGQHYANRNYFCDGNRTCSVHGWCQGKSR